MLQNQLLKLSEYNYWANEKCSGFILAAGEEKADIIQVSSFPTIRKTLYHIWDAELIWIKRLNGETIASWPPSAQFNGTLENGVRNMLLNSKIFIEYVENISEEKLQESLKYSSTNNTPFVSKIYDMIMHCMNHSTFHRGQLITMLRNSGFTGLSSTDYITFCRID